MVRFISNTLSQTLNEPFQQSHKSCKHLYILEILSQVVIVSDQKQVPLQPYDIILAQSFNHLQIDSLDRNPILLRLYSLDFAKPSPLNQYTVGDNLLIHDLMNDHTSEDAYILFTNLSDLICHAYLDALEKLENLRDNNDEQVYIDFQRQKLAGLLFTDLLRQHDAKVSKFASRFPSVNVKYASKDSQSGAIMKYVSDNVHHISLKEAAAHFSYQANYFSRLCHELFGISFNQLKTTIRLEIAKEQLRLTTKSVEEISQELGYKAVSNFHRNFKSQTGMTPNDYRQDKQWKDT